MKYTREEKQAFRTWGYSQEDAAAAWLTQKFGAQGKLLVRSFRCRGGEIDQIWEVGPCLFFVEVRCRQGSGAIESVDGFKRRKLERTASAYVDRYRGPARELSFAVLTWEGTHTSGGWKWYPQAWG